MENLSGKCAKCPFKPHERVCGVIKGRFPEFCSTKIYSEVLEKALAEYTNDEKVMEFARNSALQEAECYGAVEGKPLARKPLKPRILEIVEFCQKQGYKKLGLAFCMGLYKEAQMLNKILESYDFEVVSTVCKVGCTDKTFLGMKEEEKIREGHESMCNPIAQAMILNEAKTDFNLMLGLCVGHDSLFFKYVEAPTTVVAVKDRLMGHNPLAALYSSYFAYIKK